MSDSEPKGSGDQEGRRAFLGKASNAAMAAGLVGGYGGLGAIAVRYLYPAGAADVAWQYVVEEDAVEVGESILYRGPSGETINIARQGRGRGVDDFIALSSTCPHLGCQVRWEGQNNRFFCPCHNGLFDATGKGIGGPPGDAGQSLAEYPLKVEGDLLHIAVPLVRLADGSVAKGKVIVAEDGPQGPGHDPCLAPASSRGSKVRRG